MKIVKISRFILATLLLTLLQPAEAQQPSKVPRIGYLATRSVVPREFRQALLELGYVEGRDVVIEPRFAEGKFGRFPQFAAELVQLKVDIIATLSTPGAQAAKKATTKIPIVMVARGDPVNNGLVASLGRPGGNITGLTAQTGFGSLSGKRLELLKEIVPGLSRVGYMGDPNHASYARALEKMKRIAESAGLEMRALGIRGPADIEGVFKVATDAGVQGFVHARHAPILRGRKRIVTLAAKSGLPAVYNERGFVTDGGLMSYGTKFADLYRRQALYVDRILKGAKPAEMPVEQPVKFELFINLGVAQRMGIKIPPEVLYRADKVIR